MAEDSTDSVTRKDFEEFVGVMEDGLEELAKCFSAPAPEINIPEIKVPDVHVAPPVVNVPAQPAPVVNVPKVEIPQPQKPKGARVIERDRGGKISEIQFIY